MGALRALRQTVLAGAAALMMLVVPEGARAQELSEGLPASSILVVDPDRLFAGSKFGQRIAREFEIKSKDLATENRQIEAELIAEETALTEQRPTMEPAEFRALADAFDEKVQKIRADQEAKLRALGNGNSAAQSRFLQVAQPILEQLMVEAGAAVIMDLRGVFLHYSEYDITDAAILRIDETVGDGPVDETPQED